MIDLYGTFAALLLIGSVIYCIDAGSWRPLVMAGVILWALLPLSPPSK